MMAGAVSMRLSAKSRSRRSSSCTRIRSAIRPSRWAKASISRRSSIENGRGKHRRVDFPFGVRPSFCKMCLSCIDLCPMTITPCDGPMKPGEEYLCGKCRSQLTMNEESPATCVQCDLGKGFGCARATIA